MHVKESLETQPPARLTEAFTLVELCMAVFIMALVFGGILTAYIQGARRAEWSGYSLAAQSVGIQQIEQAWSANWDLVAGTNNLTNLNVKGWTWTSSTQTGSGWWTNTLDLPVSGANVVTVTNYVTVRLYNPFGTNVPVQMQEVTVDTVWPFNCATGKCYYVNRNVCCVAPDRQ
jgi:hypothetical protein